MTGSARSPMVSADAHARAGLSRLIEPDDAALGSFVESMGAEAVLARIREGTLQSTRLASYRARLPDLDVPADLARAAKVGSRLVTPDSEEWPSAVDDWGPRRPLALWVSGTGDLAALARRAVAVVGARACTDYGEHVAAELAAGLGDRGWTVISGAAFGVDAAAHRGCLAVAGDTVAVLACGVDVVYPSSHQRLIADIRARGVVVSELPPGARPTKTRFLGRNRIIAALGKGTVVVEAAHRSGALNTAGHTVELSRALMAVPGPVTSAMSGGCHTLIQAMNASLVTDAADVVDLVGDLGVDAAPGRRGETRPHDGLDDACLRVLDALPLRGFAGPASVARVAGLDVATVLRGLAVLAVRGLVESRDGGWRRDLSR
jgi:DNA processing protein